LNAGQLLKQVRVQRDGDRVVFQAPKRAVNPALSADVQSKSLSLSAAPNSKPLASPSEPVIDAKELERLRAQAIADGRKEGLKQAQESAERARQEDLKSLQDLMKSLASSVQSLRTHHQSSVADVVFVAVCRILGEAFVDKQVVVRAVKEALAEAGSTGAVSIEVHPRDAGTLTEASSALPLETQCTVKIVANDEVRLGGCRLQTPQGTLDARLEVQLELLKQHLDRARAAWSTQNT
jgi:flagellar biosynthesis/type III secretory pathway protein FliH